MKKVDSIITRMYNTGSVGDCLFLQFLKDGSVTFNMLIDCGGWSTKKVLIEACVKDIKSKLNGSPLDIVVVTHEHLDHVSGFNQAITVYDEIPFKRVWMAWTEDPDDRIAKKLKKDYGKKLALVKEAAELRLAKLKKLSRNSSAGISAQSRRIDIYKENLENSIEALKFEMGIDSGSGAAAKLNNSDAMKYVKGKCAPAEKNNIYKKPGEIISGLGGAEGIKFYILGPPYDDNLSGIKDELDEEEMYSLKKEFFSLNSRFFSSFPDSEIPPPFSSRYKVPDDAKKKLLKEYTTGNMAWRQIEEDWTDNTGELAIALNSFLNNTSLAMAIEFESSGKVLLFPADAQSGNWKSWHNETVKSAFKSNGGRETVKLLEDTVLYKVGHHGSHNGTASKSGLDLMKNKNLVALMPLIQDKTKQWGGAKNFPAKKLYGKLIEKTNGAIFRTDEGLITDKRAVKLRNKNFSAAARKRLKDAAGKTFCEWTIEA